VSLQDLAITISSSKTQQVQKHTRQITMKVPAAILLTTTLSVTHGWLYPQHQQAQQRSFGFALRDAASKDSTTENPCWQELSDDDCAMENIYAAHFVAKEWIQSMPCAKGVDEVRMFI
jgi:hypothetical protein